MLLKFVITLYVGQLYKQYCLFYIYVGKLYGQYYIYVGKLYGQYYRLQTKLLLSVESSNTAY